MATTDFFYNSSFTLTNPVKEKNNRGDHYHIGLLGASWHFAGLIALASLSPNAMSAESATHTSKMEFPVRDRYSAQAHRSKVTPTMPEQNQITYYGGNIMSGQTNIYYIWYGNWAGNTAKTILPFFAQNIGKSAYYNINTTYSDGRGARVSNRVHYAKSITDNYSHGTKLSDQAVLEIVKSAIRGSDRAHQRGKLPNDPHHGVYFVLTSADVDEDSGFCTQYCAWHHFNYAFSNYNSIKYAFVGNPDRCPKACGTQSISPNNNPGADGMVSAIAHELSETVTDPESHTWIDSTGKENADKCEWKFGSTSMASNGSQYNVVLNGMQFLIQENWVYASGGYCSLQY